ncbi:uncharacterized protein cd34 [Centropristis striata]|uniref:uncharacterized protein cd34 n=1 Tax=Centropristis striata TaxID=184440 RepID=UPI0027DFF2BA|nr:uncharacterized protein cd34 [Centropristis striata]XP_059188297.1 uncharacterized protein cd34 [Centropristis striata]
MAASMWRMNGLWRRMAGVLVLFALLLSNEVMCQDDASTDAPTGAPAAADASAATDAPAAPAAPDASAAPDAGSLPTDAAGGDSATPAVDFPATIIMMSPGDSLDAGSSGTTAAPTVEDITTPAVPVVPDVVCVGKEDFPSTFVRAELGTHDCEETKRTIENNPAVWCHKENCKPNLKIFQDGKNLQIASDDVDPQTLQGALQGKHLKEKLGVTATEMPSSSSGYSVFVGILVTGLLAALAITVGYLKCQRRGDTKGVKLAEEAYPVDQDNQGNTLVSVAPLNPPPENPEKPSVNGESPEEVKTQPPPPTNGTSTTKTADTEL